MISLLFVAGVYWYAEWSRVKSVAKVHRMSGKNALAYADEALNDVLIRLKSPQLKQFLDIGTTNFYSLGRSDARIDVSLARTSSDVNFVNVDVSAYAYLGKGSFTDPLTGRRCQRAVVNAKYHVINVGQFLIAVPTILQVGYGTNAANGMLYASQLKFIGCTGGCGAPTQVYSAFYFQGLEYLGAPPVVYTGPVDHAQRLSYPMNFASLDPTMRAYYQNQAPSTPAPVFEGMISEPLPYHVFFVDSNLDIAKNAPLTVQGIYVIYATGDVHIHNNITLADANSWIGVFSEKDIHLDSDAPNTLTLNGTYLCNGTFIGDPGPGGAPRSGVNLTINGGLISMIHIDIATNWVGNRNYTYQTSTSPNFLLPNFTETLEYKIVGGKLN